MAYADYKIIMDMTEQMVAKLPKKFWERPKLILMAMRLI